MKTSSPLSVALKTVALGFFLVIVTLWSMPYVTVLNPTFAKSALESSGVYDTLAKNSAQILADAEKTGAGDSAIGRALAQPFEQVLTPELLRSFTEPVLDGIGDWLDGDTPIPRFSLDTGAVRSDLNYAVATYTGARLDSLPVCPDETDYNDYDLVTATCRPPYEPTDEELLGWADEFTSQIPLLNREMVSDADLVKNPGDRSWRVIPDVYQWVRTTLCIVAGLFVVITALVLILGKNRDRTLRTLGHAFLIPAVVFLIGGSLVAAFSGSFIHELASAKTQIQSDFATDTVLPLVQTLIRGVGIWGVIFGAIFVALATAAYVTSHLLTKKQEAQTQAQATSPGWIPPNQGELN